MPSTVGTGSQPVVVTTAEGTQRHVLAARESWARRFTLKRYHHQILRAIEAAAA